MATSPPSETRNIKLANLETRLGISREDEHEFRGLTDAQWMYVMILILEPGMLSNKQSITDFIEVDRVAMYRFEASPKVRKAVAVLAENYYHIKAPMVMGKVYQQAMDGCVKSQKLFLEYYNTLPTSQEFIQIHAQTLAKWDYSLGEPGKVIEIAPAAQPPPQPEEKQELTQQNQEITQIPPETSP